MTMTVNGLHAEINTPDALMGDGTHSLPPHKITKAYIVDEYPACPDIWEHGSDKASSYFVSLEAGKGMWFDFTHNQNNKQHVAVVVSVQGINPVTGKPITELCLVQHKKQCPIHKVDFQQDRYCPTCEFKWPAQNYISTTTGESSLWLDGFRNDNGEVRQYIISEEQARGIAKQIEDKNKEFKRVWAIGFAFYLSKEQKPAPLQTMRSRVAGMSLSPSSSPSSSISISMSSSPSQTTCSPEDQVYSASNEDDELKDFDSLATSCGKLAFNMSSAPASKVFISKRKNRKHSSGVMAASRKVIETKKLEIGAGARIIQDVGIDPNSIDYWQTEPAGMIYVNFTCQETLQQILNSGKRQDKQDGSLSGLKIGN